MAAEFSANNSQLVPVNGAVIFTETPVPCRCGYIYHRNESGLFRLANRFFRQNIIQGSRRGANYEVSFHANVAVPDGQTVSADGISLAVFIDGEEDPSSLMITAPAATEVYENVGAGIIVTVPFLCGCSTVSIRNTSTIPILVQNANIVFDT